MFADPFVRLVSSFVGCFSDSSQLFVFNVTAFRSKVISLICFCTFVDIRVGVKDKIALKMDSTILETYESTTTSKEVLN